MATLIDLLLNPLGLIKSQVQPGKGSSDKVCWTINRIIALKKVRATVTAGRCSKELWEVPLNKLFGVKCPKLIKLLPRKKIPVKINRVIPGPEVSALEDD